MKTILFLAAAVASAIAQAGVSYANQVVLSSTAYNIEIGDAEYALIPTKTREVQKPGCHPNGENYFDCIETVVVESQEVIRVNIRFQDPTFGSDDGHLNGQWTSVNFKTTDFTVEEVNALKSVYPRWKHPFTHVNEKFATEKLSLSVAKVKQPIQVVDMKRSRLCQLNQETSEKYDRNCQDQVVYKVSWTLVHVATVTRK